jgi:hypothetical protein
MDNSRMKYVRRLSIGFAISFAVVFAASIPAYAQETDSADVLEIFDISPVVLDARDGEGSTIGLDFNFRSRKVLKNFDAEDAPPAEGEAAVIDVDASLGDLSLAYVIAGTAAADEERNPKDFLNALVDLQFLRSGPKWGSASGGAFVKYEADQSFDDQQSVYGLRLTYGKRNALRRNDFLAIDLNRGQVDPDGDTARETALGTSALSKYYRTEAELLYMLPLDEVIPFLGKAVRGFEFNYRYFRESGAPAAVKTAGLDSYFLRTFRLNLPRDLFIAYSSGKLPFDLKDDDFFELGLTYQLE